LQNIIASSTAQVVAYPMHNSSMHACLSSDSGSQDKFELSRSVLLLYCSFMAAMQVVTQRVYSDYGDIQAAAMFIQLNNKIPALTILVWQPTSSQQHAMVATNAAPWLVVVTSTSPTDAHDAQGASTSQGTSTVSQHGDNEAQAGRTAAVSTGISLSADGGSGSGGGDGGDGGDDQQQPECSHAVDAAPVIKLELLRSLSIEVFLSVLGLMPFDTVALSVLPQRSPAWHAARSYCL